MGILQPRAACCSKVMSWSASCTTRINKCSSVLSKYNGKQATFKPITSCRCSRRYFRSQFVYEPGDGRSLRIGPTLGWFVLRQALVRCHSIESLNAAATPITEEARRTLFPKECTEQVGLIPLEVHGYLPTWLEGDFYRNGPGMYDQMEHYFDGLAMIVHFRFQGGQVFWQQRFLDTVDYKAWRETGTPQYPAVGTNPGPLRSMYLAAQELLGIAPGITDNAAVTFYQSSDHPNEGVALTESARGMIRVDRNTLTTLGPLPLPPRSKVKGILISAHPKPLSEGMYIGINHNVPFGSTQVLCYKLGDDMRHAEPLYDLKVSNPRLESPWMHDLAVAKNYMAFIEQPLYVSVLAQLGFSADHASFNWRPEDGTTIRILALDGSGVVRTFRMRPWFCFHYANVFEVMHPKLGCCLAVDATVSSNAQAISDLYLKRMRDPRGDIEPMVLKRFYFPLDPGLDVVEEDLVEDHESYGAFMDFIGLAPGREGDESYRYLYGGTVRRPSPHMNQVTKIDVREGRVCAQWSVLGGAPASEGAMVLRPGGRAEDDGVWIQPAVDRDGRSMLVVLDAKDLSEMSRIYTPLSFCMGFHAAFLPLCGHREV